MKITFLNHVYKLQLIMMALLITGNLWGQTVTVSGHVSDQTVKHCQVLQ
jgi:hypothetical protein